MTEVLTSEMERADHAADSLRGPGQPTRFSEELGAAICRDIEQGVPVTKAFLCNGISTRTGFNWTRHRPEFARAVEAARERYRRIVIAAL